MALAKSTTSFCWWLQLCNTRVYWIIFRRNVPVVPALKISARRRSKAITISPADLGLVIDDHLHDAVEAIDYPEAVKTEFPALSHRRRHNAHKAAAYGTRDS
jgi:hypothetical protein